MSDLERVLDVVERLEKRVAAKPSLWQATVTQVEPLRVRLDTSSTDFPGTPKTLLSTHAVGDKVTVAVQDRRLTIIGKLGGNITPWETLTLSDGISFIAGNPPQARWRDGGLELRGTVSASFTTAYTKVFDAGVLPQMDSYNSVRLNPSGAGLPAGRSYINSLGEMRIATTTGTASYFVLNNFYPQN